MQTKTISWFSSILLVLNIQIQQSVYAYIALLFFIQFWAAFIIVFSLIAGGWGWICPKSLSVDEKKENWGPSSCRQKQEESSRKYKHHRCPVPVNCPRNISRSQVSIQLFSVWSWNLAPTFVDTLISVNMTLFPQFVYIMGFYFKPIMPLVLPMHPTSIWRNRIHDLVRNINEYV